MRGVWLGSGRRREPIPEGDDARVFDVDIRDVSQTGVRFECSRNLHVGQRVSVELARVGAKTATVAWTKVGLYGCDFAVPLRFQDVAGATVARTRVLLLG